MFGEFLESIVVVYVCLLVSCLSLIPHAGCGVMGGRGAVTLPLTPHKSAYEKETLVEKEHD